jgi:hypothetical protein
VAVVGQSSAGVSGDAYAILIIFNRMVPVINYNLLGEEHLQDKIISVIGLKAPRSFYGNIPQYTTGSNFHKSAKKIP